MSKKRFYSFSYTRKGAEKAATEARHMYGFHKKVVIEKNDEGYSVYILD